jgi:hypothetical protein
MKVIGIPAMVPITLMITIVSAQQLVKALTPIEQIEYWLKQVAIN